MLKEDLKITIAKAYNCSPDKVKIISIEEGSTIVNYIIEEFVNLVNKVLDTNYGMDASKLEKFFVAKTRDMLINNYKLAKTVALSI